MVLNVVSCGPTSVTSSPPEGVLIRLLHPSCALVVLLLIIKCKRAHLSVAQVSPAGECKMVHGNRVITGQTGWLHVTKNPE